MIFRVTEATLTMNSLITATTLLIALLLATSCSRPKDIAANELPEEVKQFQNTRDLCDHFRGEDGYDKERQQFLLEQMKTHCTGSDGKLKQLRLKYDKNQAILDALKKYQDRIE